MGRRDVAIIEAIYAAANSGQRVEVKGLRRGRDGFRREIRGRRRWLTRTR